MCRHVPLTNGMNCILVRLIAGPNLTGKNPAKCPVHATFTHVGDC